MEPTASALAPASNVNATTRWAIGMRSMSWPSSDRGNGGAGVVGGFDVLDGAGRVEDGGPDGGAVVGAGVVAVGAGVVGDAVGGGRDGTPAGGQREHQDHDCRATDAYHGRSPPIAR